MTEHPEHQQVRCLVVDDQRNMRKALRRILEAKLHYQVEEAGSSREAVRALNSHPTDIILCDIYMPKGDGFELLQFVRGRSIANDIPVVFISGESTKEDIVKAASFNVTDYILKPFETEDLVQKIKHVMTTYLNPAPQAKLLRHAEYLLLAKKEDEAVKIFADLLKIDPKSPRYLVGFAKSLIAFPEKKDEILDVLYKSMQLNNLYFPAYAVAADFCFLHSRLDEALQFLTQELNINGKQPRRRQVLASLYQKVGELQKAGEELRLALLDSPHDDDILLQMAQVQHALGNNDRALRYYVRTRREDSENTDALQGILDMYAEKEIQKAVYAFSDLLNQNPTQHDLLIFRAQALKIMGDDERCLADLEKYSEWHPEEHSVVVLRIQMLQKLGKEEAALNLAQELVRAAPGEDNWSRLALASLRNQKYREAIQAYDSAIKINPKSPKYHFNKGVCYENLAEWERAKDCFTTVIKLSDGHKEAHAALKRIVQKSRKIS